MSKDQRPPNNMAGTSAVIVDSIDEVKSYFSVEKPRTKPFSNIYQSNPVSGELKRVIEEEI